MTSTTQAPPTQLPLIGEESARYLAHAALTDAGVPEADARQVADALVDTSLRGIDTHGLRLLPQYLDELASGVARSAARTTVVRDRGAGLLLDADGSLGVLAGLVAARLAAERAARFGVAAVGVRNSNHFGAASVYTRQLARQGLVGIAVTSAASRVAPYGGIEPLFGTNPISVAAGSDGTEFALDMATSQVCFGEIKQRRADGRRLDPGWTTDADGQPTQQPDEAYALSPLGGYKGQGLAMAVTLLGAALTGSPPDWRLTQVGAGEPGRSRQVGHLVLALDPGAFCGRERFDAGLADLLATVRSAAPAGDRPVLAPGDPQRDHERQRRARGIPLDARTADVLAELARRVGTEGPTVREAQA
ncbi:Ldh family oxidoreductase [Streptantibioticus rubrisoli]|uniref:Ldh family oxidoreductase n=1 Tax=Streptantibioticus rubrisoli TaxID=1387313 RepID=A0ABT1P7E2_9ACTN|nr:Ldh family oxidoreductase [Streptantibioticus rubrisoli]MCQ4041302.1 Ldh family oxidoreductase [Streptantibioticus rubrisoli]